MARLRPRRGAADYAPLFTWFPNKVHGMFRHAIYPAGSTCSGSVGALLYAPLWFSQNKAPFRVGFEPTYAGYGPAALPFSYPLIAVDAFCLQGASQAGTKGEPAHGDCCLRLSEYKTHFYACGSRTRRPPVNCRVLPCEANAPKMLLSVSLQSTA